MISYLKKDLDTAAAESVTALEALSVDAHQDYSPIWYVHSDRAIHRNLERLAEGVTRGLIVLCFNSETLAAFQGPIASVARDRDVRVLLPQGRAGRIAPHAGIRYFEAGESKDFFEVNIFEKIFSAPIPRKGALFRLECIYIADDRESMLVYTQNWRRMGVIITLPFITRVQSRPFSQMIDHARELAPGETDAFEERVTIAYE